ncbi:hypothetical protein EOD23_31485, partial [Mesorhizobium sp. USDA-HM6]
CCAANCARKDDVKSAASLSCHARARRLSPEAYAQCGGCPFLWGLGPSQTELSKVERKLFAEAAEFGISCGLTVPIIDNRGCFAAVTFATDEPRPDFVRITERYQQILLCMASCFHIYARRKLSTDRIVNGVQLTPREFECLQWAAKGKCDWATGRILGIARRTVSFHLDNVREKLGVETTRQAIALLGESDSSRH